jgi:hypothetical protein
MKLNLPLALAFLICLLLTLVASGIPLFWDSVYYALPVLKGGKEFTPFHIPESLDTGGFPFYAAWLSLFFRLCGTGLLSVHLALLPFLLGSVFAFYRIGRRFLNNTMLSVALLLLFLEPCFITQSILAAPDLMLLAFFLLALMALLENKRLLFSIFLILLVFCNMRGLPAAASLLIMDFLFASPSERWNKNKVFAWLPVFVFSAVWFLYHHAVTGWYFFSPWREKTDEHGVSITIMLKHVMLVLWKLADSGRIILWLFLAAAIVYFRKAGSKDPVFYRLLRLLLPPLFFFSLLLIPLSNPIGARYFMPVFALLILPVCYLIQQWKTTYQRISVLLIAIVLVSGNFWIYPERLSNEWDTSLKVLPFFSLEQQMREYIYTHSLRDKQLSPYNIGTQFPLIYSPAETYLSPGSTPDIIAYFDFNCHYTNALDGPVSKFHYYLHSNVCNTDLLPQIEEIKTKWKLVKEFREGEVYLVLYENTGL